MSTQMSLLEEAKLELRFDLSVADVELDTKLNTLIERGKAYLDGKMGVVVDYNADGNLRALLMAYVRYAYNDATELFIDNFYDDVFCQQIQYAINEREMAKNADAPTT